MGPTPRKVPLAAWLLVCAAAPSAAVFQFHHQVGTEYYRNRSAQAGGKARPPFEPRRLRAPSAAEFAKYVKEGVPVIVEGGLVGTSFDTDDAARREEWTCLGISKRFPTGHMSLEYADDRSKPDAHAHMAETEAWMKRQVPSGAATKLAPKFAPFYWGIKAGNDGEHVWTGKKNLLKEVQKLMKPLPAFLSGSEENLGEILGSPEFWFAPPGAGAKAHMDQHCESTLTLQLDGTKRWRLSWPPQVPPGSFAAEGTFGDGKPYEAIDGWKPGFVFNLSRGEVLLIPPGFIHESLNPSADDCSPSLTFQFRDPTPATYWRNYLSRLRRIGDFNECWHRIDGLATFSPLRRGKTGQRLKRLGVASIKELSKYSEDILEAHVADAAENAWKQVLEDLDRNKDGKVNLEDGRSGLKVGAKEGEAPPWLRSSVEFYDVDGDGAVSEDEFHAIFVHWLETEASAVREKRVKAKKLRRMEL